MLETLGWIRLVDILDVLVVATLLWTTILLLRRTRARTALVGLAILGLIYLISGRIGLRVTAWILQGFFAVLVLVLVVVFQEDLRRFFEQIAAWSLGSRRRPVQAGVTEVLVRTVTQLASTRTGALLVLPGREALDRHMQGGILVGGKVSEPLLLSLFDASSPGHDGAVVIRDSKIERFAAHLPLSSDHEQLGPGGTRHAAALGLAERTDALCVVVSEERGTVSVAQQGELRLLRGPEELASPLRAFLRESLGEDEKGRTVWLGLRQTWREAALSVIGAAVIWIFFVPGSTPIEVVQHVPVRFVNLPKGYILESVDPAEAEVILTGARRDILLLDREKLEIRVDGLLAQLGRRTFQLSATAVEVPASVEVVALTPDKVKISVVEPEERQPVELEQR
jgi:uncharacterized protein (TIGR00159 family)